LGKSKKAWLAAVFSSFDDLTACRALLANFLLLPRYSKLQLHSIPPLQQHPYADTPQIHAENDIANHP
jgi:hypothetical protein